MLSLLLLQPISEWTVANVVEWMAAANLYRYVDLFRDRQVTGKDLLAMDENKLMVSVCLRRFFIGWKVY